jgi:hypothetical protein
MSKSTAVSVLDQFDPGKLPAHMADMAEDSNIAPKMTVPSLSYEGKTWTVIKDGEKKKLMRKNEDGDQEPITTFQGVILGYAPRRGRAYYEGAYDPNKISAPTCWSDDGVKPHASIDEPVNPKCDGCPMSIKGSRQTDQGKASVACSQHLLLAVVPAAKLDFTPLRLKLAITSIWDKDQTEAGWYAFDQYLDQFRAKKVPHTAMVVTKFRFDPNVAFPKVMFQPARWLTAEELEVVKPIVKSDEVAALVSGSWTPAGGDGTKTDEPKAAPKKAAAKPAPEPEEEEADEEEEEAPPPKKAPAKKATKPAPAPEPEEEEEDGLELEEAEEPAPPPKKAPAKKAAAKPAKEEAEDADFEMEEVETAPPAKKGVPAKKKAAAAEDDEEGPEMARPAKKPAKGGKADDGLDGLLDEWAD